MRRPHVREMTPRGHEEQGNARRWKWPFGSSLSIPKGPPLVCVSRPSSQDVAFWVKQLLHTIFHVFRHLFEQRVVDPDLRYVVTTQSRRCQHESPICGCTSSSKLQASRPQALKGSLEFLLASPGDGWASRLTSSNNLTSRPQCSIGAPPSPRPPLSHRLPHIYNRTS